jgi:hypothetical protein
MIMKLSMMENGITTILKDKANLKYLASFGMKDNSEPEILLIKEPLKSMDSLFSQDTGKALCFLMKNGLEKSPPINNLKLMPNI